MHDWLFALAVSTSAPFAAATPAPAPPPVREASPEDRYSTIAYDPTEDAEALEQALDDLESDDLLTLEDNVDEDADDDNEWDDEAKDEKDF